MVSKNKIKVHINIGEINFSHVRYVSVSLPFKTRLLLVLVQICVAI